VSNTLRFRHTEEGPDPHAYKYGTEEKECAVFKVRDHVRRGSCDNERTKPGIGSREGDTQHANVEREYFTGVSPCDTSKDVSVFSAGK
jgi:hypothetical protein